MHIVHALHITNSILREREREVGEGRDGKIIFSPISGLTKSCTTG